MITLVGRLRRGDVGNIIIIYFHRCCWMFMGVKVVGIVIVVDVISRDV